MSSEPRPGEGSPDWIRDAAARAVEEVRLYARTALRFTLRPGRFARAWASGEQAALNPLAMLATAAGLVGGANNLLGRLLEHGGGDGDSLLMDVLAAGAPFAHYALLGLVCHLLLRLAGSRRRLRDSLALALFAGAGPAALANLLVDATGALLWLHAGRPPVLHGGLFATLHGPARTVLSVCSFGGLFAFLAAFALSMRALHQRGVLVTLLALVATLSIAGVAFGLLPPLPFGTRIVVKLHPLSWSIWVD